MKLYSNKFLYEKNHKNSISSNRTPMQNIDINISKPDYDELLSDHSNYTSSESDSSTVKPKSNKNRNNRSFHEHSKIIHDFNSNLEKEDKSIILEIEKINENTNYEQNHFFENSKKSFSKYQDIFNATVMNVSSVNNKNDKKSFVDSKNMNEKIFESSERKIEESKKNQKENKINDRIIDEKDNNVYKSNKESNDKSINKMHIEGRIYLDLVFF